MKITCGCGQKLSLEKGVQSGQLNCPKCQKILQWGPPQKVGNFKVGVKIATEKGLILHEAKQAALQLKARVLLFKSDENPRVIVAAKRLASATFETPVQLLDMGVEGEWSYVALQGDVSAKALMDWFLKGSSTGVKRPLAWKKITAILLLSGVGAWGIGSANSPGFLELPNRAQKMYTSEDWKERRNALFIVDPGVEGEALLIKALGDTRHFVRLEACRQLAKRDGDAVEKALRKTARSDRAKTVRNAARKALKQAVHL